jgi:hypothetical protein
MLFWLSLPEWARYVCVGVWEFDIYRNLQHFLNRIVTFKIIVIYLTMYKN